MGSSCGIKQPKEASTPKAVMDSTTDWERVRAMLQAQDSEVNDATITTLQSAFRGYIRRKQLQAVSSEEILELSDDEAASPITAQETDIDPVSLLTAKALKTLLRLEPFEMQKTVKGVVQLGARALQGGGVYVGEWSLKSQCTLQKGRGRLYGSNGSYTEGYWKSGRLYYRARYIFPNGDYYEGNYDHGIRHGHGIYESFDQLNRYQGEWKNGRKHGQGQETFAHGITYMGSYKYGWRSGEGLMTWKDGRTYQGEFNKDQITGKGEMKWADGRHYVGSFENAKMHGSGSFVYPDGKSYEGEYMYDKKHGRGVYRWDGHEYNGEWRDGQMHGLGYLAKRGEEQKMVLFEHGKLKKEVGGEISSRSRGNQSSRNRLEAS